MNKEIKKFLIKEIKESRSYYTHNNEEGLLIYIDEINDLTTDYNIDDIEPMEEHGDVGFYSFDDLTEKILKAIANNELTVCCTYSASYCGLKGEGENIKVCQMQNIEYHQQLIYVWEEEDVYQSDLYERELLIVTDRFYNWTSERAAIEEDVYQAIKRNDFLGFPEEERKSLSENWAEICSNYTDPMGALPLPPSIDDIINIAISKYY